MSTTQTEAEKPQMEAAKPIIQTASPRKRRRRAPATGAADDCFACQERQAKCDRRRPYCTPCLDIGKDCSGYKTALTWGVGVASRGKLRGLSLPIASSKRAAPSGDDDEESNESPLQKVAKLGPPRRASDPKSSSQLDRAPTRTASTTSTSTPTNYGFVNIDPSSASSAMTSPSYPSPNFQWKRPASMSHSRGLRLIDKKPRRHTLQPIQVTSMHPARDYGVMPMTASVVGGYGHHDFGLSSQISPMVPAFSGYEIASPSHKTYSQPHGASYESDLFTSGNLPWSGAHHASSIASDHSSSRTGAEDVQGYFGVAESMIPLQQDLISQGPPISSAPSEVNFMIDSKFQAFAGDLPPLVPDDVGDHHTLMVPRSLSSLSIGNSPKLQFLIDYYDKVISPVIVAFDGPTNPYRSHILSLAVESETLQHAIAALSSSNIRMRRSQNPLSTNRSLQSTDDSSHDQSVRKSSLAHSLMDTRTEGLPQTSTSEPSTEELYHKGQAIKLLNEQLTDPARRRDDSILASLLILCLYHICDTGVAKFKTQFAGVKKILALRGGTKGINSKATNWLTIMFTWFDAMAATVNDRESQLSGDDIDISKFSGDEWALENLAGCDGRLFKTIAKLGRLNMLSQNKTTKGSSPRSSPIRKTSQSVTPPSQDYYSMNNNRFDGNGWSELPSNAQVEGLDSRSQFWPEWTEIRQQLQDWQFDGSVRTPTESSDPQGDRQDLLHISESFRYSALLYTERLAYPHLPSAHPNFQSLVTQALYNISNVKSDVFLLWPLFITGTECVSEQGRFLIRNRCLDIQKDSGFFNNISCLELLEKTWRDDCNDSDGAGMQPMTGMGAGEYTGNGFKWRKAMDRVDGEYIVV
ncbi:uncharacterized protein KY384_007891 [Bacidia gigantensis]|uniref:uncharacterized protein n=1 Tax=Bacidia gigantensis TaxID=2732470 RepID=UPI001D04F479|nr:uncharacterized protein KY384_007891 [Bacidia gigantensis]KAG8527737.1 hypothetical protein KY384_007891 [Bacidia gigantensis]